MSQQIDIAQHLAGFARRFDGRLDRLLDAPAGVPKVLGDAVKYAAGSGGKRVRPFIVTRMCELCGGTEDDALPAAAALECVHAFSLVHDDLPAMDNDDFRRGLPTCHKAFGEAVAILAGDALLALAFELLTTRWPDADRSTQACRELARGTGWTGMIGGQTNDIMSEKLPANLDLVREIHRGKTARLFETAGRLGAIAARADERRTGAAADFGNHLGLAFQIADDILDVTGSASEMGKAVAKDAQAGKQTYPAAVGLEESRRIAREIADRAIRALDPFGAPAEDLRSLVRFVLDRKK
jgi:geranylgeranyl diphosphate synthase type II